MSTAARQSQSRITVKDFLNWSEEQRDDARYDLVARAPLRLTAPTNLRHAQIQSNASQAVRRR